MIDLIEDETTHIIACLRENLIKFMAEQFLKYPITAASFYYQGRLDAVGKLIEKLEQK